MTTTPPPRACPTPEHLTEVLRRAGDLRAGGVAEVAAETSRTTLVSTITRLRLTYADAEGGGPAHVLLKTPREDRWSHLDRIMLAVEDLDCRALVE